MDAKTVAKVVYQYTNGCNANELPQEKKDKLQKFWQRLEDKRSIDFIVNVVAVANLMKIRKVEVK